MVEINVVIGMLFLLILKHFVADFLLQPACMYENKGKLFHIGGWIHALFHSLLTVMILFSYGISFKASMVVMIAETIIHFTVDFLKVNISETLGYHPKTPEFWILLGLDQFLHYVSYLWIVWFVYSYNVI